jgi:hypothetical protein
MKVITRKEMLRMPKGTVYSYYEPHFFRELEIKADDPENYDNDWLFDSIVGAVKNNGSGDFSDKCTLMKAGESVEVDFENTSRDGMFEDEQLYAVYEKEDVEKLIARLQQTLRLTKDGLT